MNKNDYQTTRIWTKTHSVLRKIAAETGESIVEVMDRLSRQELQDIERRKTVSTDVTKRWAESMLQEAVDDLDKKDVVITPVSFSKYFETEYDLPFSPEEAKSWLEQQSWYQPKQEWMYHTVKFEDITATDLRSEALKCECEVQYLHIHLRGHAERADALYIPDIQRMGIAWGTDATWADADSIEQGIETWINEGEEWERRN